MRKSGAGKGKSKNTVKNLRPQECTLADLRPEEKATVVALRTRIQGQLRTLMALSILPGLRVKAVQNFPTPVYQAGYFQFALDDQLSRLVLVRKTTVKQARSR